MKSMNGASSEIKPQALLEEFAEILEFVQTSFQQTRTAHEVETGLWQRMLNLGHSLFGAWLDLFGEGDAGDRIVLGDGRAVRRLDTLHGREVRNVFGLFELMRAVYTVDPFIRTSEEVLDALFQEAPACEPPPSRPRPCFKYVRAALQRDDMDSTAPQVQAIFGWMVESGCGAVA